MAILFGPFGCTLRWLLSMTNYKLPGSWKWLPIGTFAANMLGCTIDYFVGVSHLPCLSNVLRPFPSTSDHIIGQELLLMMILTHFC